jgi:hypothetical protein
VLHPCAALCDDGRRGRILLLRNKNNYRKLEFSSVVFAATSQIPNGPL